MQRQFTTSMSAQNLGRDPGCRSLTMARRGMGLFGKKWYSEALEENAVFMNDDFCKQRAREVRDIAAKADPFIKQRLLDLADRYDGKPKTSITPLPSVPAVAQNPSGEHDGNSG
jgi:hypothetical protein